MIFLTAPSDLHTEMAYEVALEMLIERYGADRIGPDRELFRSTEEYNDKWIEVYDPEKADRLYILSREDGTIDSRVYQKWSWLADSHGVPATLLMLAVGTYDERAEFSVSLIEGSARSERVFAAVSPAPIDSVSSGRRE